MTVSKLTGGVNLWGFSAGVNMAPGEAQDARDVLPRGDGAIFKHHGWERLNAASLADRIVAHKGFAYKGKNNNTAVNPARGGNFGIADDGAIFTKRQAFYSTAIILTEGEFRYWDPATETLAGPVALPGGVAIAIDPKPTIIIYNDNAYIVGFADANLRYDPVDRALYEWGWAAVPANAGHTGLQAGGTLVANATYRYRLSWVDLYTGEESGLSVEYVATTTAANRTVLLDNFIAYVGARHFTDAVNLTNNDVGIVVYRTGPDDQTFHFLDLVEPGLAAATVTDNGLATDTSLKADVRTYEDPPRLNTFTEFRDQWYGVSWDNNWARVYHNDFRKENSFWERSDPRGYREFPVQEGETLLAVAKTDRSMVVFSNYTAYEYDAVPSTSTGLINRSVRPTNWTIGCVGPKAWAFIDGYLYWLSDRGPYRWPPGGQPEWIGKAVSPLFLDPTSGLCQLSEPGRGEAEVLYDQDADVVRWIFACGASTVPNRHLMYWAQSEAVNGNPSQGWFPASAEAQSLDYTNAYGPLVGGLPVTPEDLRGRCIFSAGGFLVRYDPALQRSDIPDPAAVVTGVGQAGSGINLLVTAGGLYNVGDGLEDMRVEVVHTDGTVDVRRINSNTAVNIVPDVGFTQDPTGATWYICGIPAFWRSWVDHAGDPAAHKTLRHLWVGYNQEFTAAGTVLNVSVAGGDFPTAIDRRRTADLSNYRAQLLVSLTNRFFTYEIANTRPDEPFVITYIDPELQVLERRRA